MKNTIDASDGNNNARSSFWFEKYKELKNIHGSDTEERLGTVLDLLFSELNNQYADRLEGETPDAIIEFLHEMVEKDLVGEVSGLLENSFFNEKAINTLRQGKAAIHYSKSFDMAFLLKCHGADIHLKDESGQTLLQILHKTCLPDSEKQTIDEGKFYINIGENQKKLIEFLTPKEDKKVNTNEDTENRDSSNTGHTVQELLEKNNVEYIAPGVSMQTVVPCVFSNKLIKDLEKLDSVKYNHIYSTIHNLKFVRARGEQGVKALQNNLCEIKFLGANGDIRIIGKLVETLDRKVIIFRDYADNHEIAERYIEDFDKAEKGNILDEKCGIIASIKQEKQIITTTTTTEKANEQTDVIKQVESDDSSSTGSSSTASNSYSSSSNVPERASSSSTPNKIKKTKESEIINHIELFLSMIADSNKEPLIFETDSSEFADVSLSSEESEMINKMQMFIKFSEPVKDQNKIIIEHFELYSKQKSRVLELVLDDLGVKKEFSKNSAHLLFLGLLSNHISKEDFQLLESKKNPEVVIDFIKEIYSSFSQDRPMPRSGLEKFFSLVSYCRKSEAYSQYQESLAVNKVVEFLEKQMIPTENVGFIKADEELKNIVVKYGFQEALFSLEKSKATQLIFSYGQEVEKIQEEKSNLFKLGNLHKSYDDSYKQRTKVLSDIFSERSLLFLESIRKLEDTEFQLLKKSQEIGLKELQSKIYDSIESQKIPRIESPKKQKNALALKHQSQNEQEHILPKVSEIYFLMSEIIRNIDDIDFLLAQSGAITRGSLTEIRYENPETVSFVYMIFISLSYKSSDSASKFLFLLSQATPFLAQSTITDFKKGFYQHLIDNPVDNISFYSMSSGIAFASGCFNTIPSVFMICYKCDNLKLLLGMNIIRNSLEAATDHAYYHLQHKPIFIKGKLIQINPGSDTLNEWIITLSLMSPLLVHAAYKNVNAAQLLSGVSSGILWQHIKHISVKAIISSACQKISINGIIQTFLYTGFFKTIHEKASPLIYSLGQVVFGYTVLSANEISYSKELKEVESLLLQSDKEDDTHITIEGLCIGDNKNEKDLEDILQKLSQIVGKSMNCDNYHNYMVFDEQGHVVVDQSARKALFYDQWALENKIERLKTHNLVGKKNIVIMQEGDFYGSYASIPIHEITHSKESAIRKICYKYRIYKKKDAMSDLVKDDFFVNLNKNKAPFTQSNFSCKNYRDFFEFDNQIWEATVFNALHNGRADILRTLLEKKVFDLNLLKLRGDQLTAYLNLLKLRGDQLTELTEDMWIDDLVKENFVGSTLLIIASYTLQEDMVELFLDKGADIKAKTESGDTAFTAVLRKKCHNTKCTESDKEINKKKLNIISILMKHIDLNQKNIELIPTISYIVKHNPELLKGMIKIYNSLSGITLDFNVPDLNGDIAMHTAVRMNDIKSIKILCKYGASIDVQHPESGDTPLHTAVRMNNLEMMKVLIKKGANIKIANHNDEFPSALADGAEIQFQLANIIEKFSSSKEKGKYVFNLLYRSAENVHIEAFLAISKELRLQQHQQYKELLTKYCDSINLFKEVSNTKYTIEKMLMLGELIRSDVCDQNGKDVAIDMLKTFGRVNPSLSVYEKTELYSVLAYFHFNNNNHAEAQYNLEKLFDIGFRGGIINSLVYMLAQSKDSINQRKLIEVCKGSFDKDHDTKFECDKILNSNNLDLDLSGESLDNPQDEF